MSEKQAAAVHETTAEHDNETRQVEEELSREQELIARALEGDAAAKTQIVLDHQQNVYNLGLRLMGDEDGAECVLQDTFLKVFEKLSDFRRDSKLGTWIHRIAANEALMQLRKKKGKYFIPIVEHPLDSSEEEPPGFVAETLNLDPLESALNEELRRELEKAIYSLPMHLRTAFVLKDLEGLTMAEIAEETGKSVSAVKANLHRARVRLRKRLAELAIADDGGAA